MDAKDKKKKTLEVKKLESEIRDKLQNLRTRLANGNETEIVVWVIPYKLACSQRPLRDHPEFGGSGRPLPLDARPLVIRWVAQIKKMGICSVICLMHSKELKYYDGLELNANGLLGFYKNQGFQVCHLPWPDPAHEGGLKRQRIEEIKREALSAFRGFPKPVLLHCSAAIDRTTPVAAFIVQETSE